MASLQRRYYSAVDPIFRDSSAYEAVWGDNSGVLPVTMETTEFPTLEEKSTQFNTVDTGIVPIHKSTLTNETKISVPTFTRSFSPLRLRPKTSCRGKDMYSASNYYQRLVSDSSQLQPALFQNGYLSHQVAQSVTVKKHPNPGPPVFRTGRLGASWRHVKQCTSNTGSHICFVDGVIKLNDSQQHPPYGYGSNPSEMSNLPRLTDPGQPSYRSTQRNSGGYNNLSSSYNQHARNGFRYWYEEKKPVSLRPKRTISGNLMKLGVGY